TIGRADDRERCIQVTGIPDATARIDQAPTPAVDVEVRQLFACDGPARLIAEVSERTMTRSRSARSSGRLRPINCAPFGPWPDRLSARRHATTEAAWNISVGMGWSSCQVMAIGRSPVWEV